MVYGIGFLGRVISLAALIWFMVFSILVLQKLDKMIELLGKK